MDACRSLQLPVPKIYVSRAGHAFEELADGRKFGFMQYVEGEEPANFTQPMIATLAKTIAKMNVLGQTFTFPAPRSWQGTIVDLAQERIAAYRSKGIQDEFVDHLANELKQQLAQTDLTATIPLHHVNYGMEVREIYPLYRPLSHFGAHQFHLPISRIAAGTSNNRMRVASIRTAAASANPSCFISSM